MILIQKMQVIQSDVPEWWIPHTKGISRLVTPPSSCSALSSASQAFLMLLPWGTSIFHFPLPLLYAYPPSVSFHLCSSLARDLKPNKWQNITKKYIEKQILTASIEWMWCVCYILVTSGVILDLSFAIPVMLISVLDVKSWLPHTEGEAF